MSYIILGVCVCVCVCACVRACVRVCVVTSERAYCVCVVFVQHVIVSDLVNVKVFCDITKP